MSENYKHLVESLKRFKNKFLFFNLIRGVLLLFSLLILYFSVALIAEDFLYLKPEVKVYIFFISLLFLSFIIIWFLFYPLAKLFGIREKLTNKDIAEKIRKYIPEIDDSLINAIELAEDVSNEYSNELVIASIDQKIENLKIIDFSSALKISNQKKFIERFLIVCSVFFVLFLFFKNEMVDSAGRLIHYQSEFIKPAPFHFELQNEKLDVKKGSGLKIELKMTGKKIPTVVYISFGGNNFLMKKTGENNFVYEIENINNSFTFYFVANNYYSRQYRINVLSVPLLGSFSVEIIPPTYTGLKNEVFSNVGNLKVPHGSIVKWNFKTFETSELVITINDSVKTEAKGKPDDYVFEKKVLKSFTYSVTLKNENFSEENILSFKVDVLPDLYPQIEIAQVRDSINFFRYYFKGRISDDYGFSNMTFNLFFEGNDSIITIPFVKSLNQQEFYFTYDFNDLKKDNRVINYYFSVFDNDYFSGNKETSSESFTINFPDLKNRMDFENSEFNDLEKLMNESFSLNKQIKSDINDLKMNQINSNLTEWEKEQKINEIVEKRNTLENVLNEISKKNKELDNYKNSFSEKKSEIVEKQKQVDELLKEIFSDELKKLFDEFNQLAKNFNSKKLDELTNDMDMQLDDLSKQLERNLEILKRMKVVQKVQNIIDELNKIAENEKSLTDDFQKKKNFDNTRDLQKVANQNFDLQKDEYSKIFELNKELKKSLNIPDFKMEFNEIGEEFINSLSLLDNKKKKQVTEEFKNISGKIQNLAFSIQQMLDANEKKTKGEDLENLQQIMDNLVYLSLFQEQLYKQLKTLQKNDPLLNSVKINQLQIVDQTIIVKDSLYTLAERNPQISSVVNREILNIQMNSNDALKMLEDGRIYNVLIYQQKIMTSFNNLALFLSEIIKKAEEEMENSVPGDQACDKPGKGKKPNLNLLKQSQESIKKQLQNMIDQMKSGNMEGITKQLGKTLAQQEIMQQLIREMMGSSEIGSSAKEQLKMADKLIEENKRDVISKNISEQTINRQNMILNKLLNAEISEIERDDDNERKSETAKDDFYSNPNLFFQYKKDENENKEQLIRNTYKLEHYYEEKYKNYINYLEH